MSELPKYPVNVPDPIGDLMNDLRTRGRARLIAGWFDNVDEIEVTAEISRQWDVEDPNVMHEELVVTLDTLETLLRWNRESKKGFHVTDGKLEAPA